MYELLTVFLTLLLLSIIARFVVLPLFYTPIFEYQTYVRRNKLIQALRAAKATKIYENENHINFFIPETEEDLFIYKDRNGWVLVDKKGRIVSYDINLCWIDKRKNKEVLALLEKICPTSNFPIK